MKKANTLSFIDLFPHLGPKFKRQVLARTYRRWGGVSPPPFDSLNLGLFTQDERENVYKNIERVKEDLGLEGLKVVALEQVHGDRAIAVDGSSGLISGRGDALLTDKSGVVLLIQHADCQPVLLFDPVNLAIGAVHVGWKGLRDGVLNQAISRMNRLFLSSPKDLWVGIGPAIGPCCYEFSGWKELLPQWMKRFVGRNGRFHLKEATKEALVSIGVLEQKIYIAPQCTRCSPDFFSYRRDGITGRLGSVILLI